MGTFKGDKSEDPTLIKLNLGAGIICNFFLERWCSWRRIYDNCKEDLANNGETKP